MGKKVSIKNEVIKLDNFNVLSGGHCESSAIMNALNYQGVQLKECVINGFASSASFVFNSKDKFPFLGMRSHELKENFSQTTGIKFQVHQPDTPQQAYDESKDILKKGIPIVLRVDMRYLPYLHGGKYGSPHTSFGWHFITLVKIDETKGYAWVTDTEYDSLQQIKISDLAKARNSKSGQFKAGNYFYYFVEPEKVKIDIPSAFTKSIEGYISNYEGTDGILNRMKTFPDDIKHIEDNHSQFMMSPLFYTWHGYIETFGTGGSGFRRFLYDYLLEMNKMSMHDNLKNIIMAANKSCESWSALALKFQSISQVITSLKKDKSARFKLYTQASELALDVYKAENGIYNELKAIFT